MTQVSVSPAILDPFDTSRMKDVYRLFGKSPDHEIVHDLFLRAIQVGRDLPPPVPFRWTDTIEDSASRMWEVVARNSVSGTLLAIVEYLMEVNAYALKLQIYPGVANKSVCRALQLSTLDLLREIEDGSIDTWAHRLNSTDKPGYGDNIGTSIGEALVSLTEDLTEAGKTDARAFHLGIENVCTYLFSPALVAPRIEQRRSDGLKFVDIAYTNVAESGFFSWLRSTINCMFIWIEVKNYGKDPTNPEIDQLAGRLNSAAGMFGILITREIANRERMDRRASRLFADGKWVLVLDLKDLRQIAKERKRSDAGFDHLRERMRDVVAHW